MNEPKSLSAEQRHEARAICDEICERLETEDEYIYDLNERRGKAGSFPDDVWDEALRMLEKVGWHARRTGAMVLVRKR